MLFSLGFLLDAAVALSAQPSHLGQKVSDHVSLRASRSGNQLEVCNEFVERVFPNGTSQQFFVPSGRWFVVTDVTWRTIVGPGFPVQHPGLLTLRIFLGEEGSPLFESSVVLKADDIGDPVVGSEHLTTGFVVAGTPCFAFQQPQNDDGSVGGAILLHGYFIDRPGGR